MPSHTVQERGLYGGSRQMVSGGILINYECEQIFFTDHSLIWVELGVGGHAISLQERW